MSHEKFESKRKRMKVNYNEGSNLLHFTAGNDDVSDNITSSEDERKFKKKEKATKEPVKKVEK